MMIQIEIGGDGVREEMTVTIAGCSCRTEDFVMALVGFANEWKARADMTTRQVKTEPCKCKDAQ